MNIKNKKMILGGLTFFIVCTTACGQNGSSAMKNLDGQLAKQSVSSVNDSLYYAIGYNLQKDMTRFFGENKMALSEKQNMDIFIKGFLDAFNSRNTLFDETTSRDYINKQIQKIKESMSSEALQKGTQFLEANKKNATIKELPGGSGIQYTVIKNGTGSIKPTEEDTVVCHYVGTLIDGKEFDNSVKRGQPATFPLGGVIKGWQLALAQMKEGDKWKIFIPSELGYGSNGAGGVIPPNSVLIFEVELIKVHKKK